MTNFYKELSDFIQNKMRMSHIYQPVMLISLLKNAGICHEGVLARDLLIRDESQVEYYTQITNNMVGRILRKRNLVERDSSTKSYSLKRYHELSHTQRDALVGLCEDRLNAFLKARGQSIFDHRRKSSGYISGTIKYEILKRARFRCELCGTSADVKALEVDHILPRNKGGSDDPSNFQALCYSCNAMKRDRDDTDLRDIRLSYSRKDAECVFCNIQRDRIISENELAYLIRDGFPVVQLHSLIIPKRHVADYFGLGQPEINACSQLMELASKSIQADDKSVEGFNIGINNGAVAGQTILHCHIHLIPRRRGDVPIPRGGVRHIIPGKGDYRET